MILSDKTKLIILTIALATGVIGIVVVVGYLYGDFAYKKHMDQNWAKELSKRVHLTTTTTQKNHVNIPHSLDSHTTNETVSSSPHLLPTQPIPYADSLDELSEMGSMDESNKMIESDKNRLALLEHDSDAIQEHSSNQTRIDSHKNTNTTGIPPRHIPRVNETSRQQASGRASRTNHNVPPRGIPHGHQPVSSGSDKHKQMLEKIDAGRLTRNERMNHLMNHYDANSLMYDNEHSFDYEDYIDAQLRLRNESREMEDYLPDKAKEKATFIDETRQDYFAYPTTYRPYRDEIYKIILPNCTDREMAHRLLSQLQNHGVEGTIIPFSSGFQVHSIHKVDFSKAKYIEKYFLQMGVDIVLDAN